MKYQVSASGEPATTESNENSKVANAALDASPNAEAATGRSMTVVHGRRPSIRKSKSVRRVLRRYHDWKTEHMYLGRYSVDKMLAFEEYQQVASPWRVLAVIALTPLPGLLIMILLAAIPLQNPLLGIPGNSGYFVQSWLAYTTMTLAMMFFIRASLQLPNSVYSNKQCVLISLLTAGANELAMLALSAAWRFPIPFRTLVGIPTYSINLLVVHRLVIGTKWLQYRDAIAQYLPLLMAQSSTLFIFEGITLLYAHAPALAQAGITIAFPVLRAIVKRFIWRFSRHLEDISIDVTLCVMEIFGSLFQNACLQTHVRLQLEAS